MRKLLKLMTSDHLVLQPLCYVLSQLNLYLITDTQPRQYLDNSKITVGCLMANYGLVLRGECDSPNVNHCISFEIFDSMGTESLVTRLSQLLWQGAPWSLNQELIDPKYKFSSISFQRGVQCTFNLARVSTNLAYLKRYRTFFFDRDCKMKI